MCIRDSFKCILQFITCFPCYINKSETSSAFGRYSLVVQNKFIKLLYLLMAGPVNSFNFLFKLLNVFNMYKVACYNPVPITYLLHHEKTKFFRCLILKVFRNSVNMMI